MARYDEDTKIFKEISKFKVKCACGHTFATTKDKDLCTWCGNYAYKDKKMEFKDKISKKIKERNEEK